MMIPVFVFDRDILDAHQATTVGYRSFWLACMSCSRPRTAASW